MRFSWKTGVVWMGIAVSLRAHGLWAQIPAAPDPGGGAATTSGPPPMTDIHDIKPLTSVFLPGSFPKGLWYVMAGLLLTGLIILAFRYWRKKKRPRDIFPAEVILPPEVVAGQALEALRADGQIPDKAFYFRLSAILRTYLSGRFGVDGLEMTTEELLPAVERLEIDRVLKSGIKEFLLFSDPVKFADLSAPRPRRDRDLDFVTVLVKQTTSDSAGDETTGAKAPLTPVSTGKSIA